ncbi:Protein CHROMATIN REMODELING 5 [Balamuthia mandrillaris]
MKEVGRYVAVYLCLFIVGGYGKDSCKLSTGAHPYPPDGACDGPTERAFLRRANLQISNYGCPLDQVAYYVDGNASAPITCGECIPGSWENNEDVRYLCGMNEFCSDNGRCLRSTSSPLYGQPCPFGGGTYSLSSFIWSGYVWARCLVCEDGVVDPRDGKVCYKGEWTYSKWDTMWEDPEAVFLFVVMLLLIFHLFAPLFVRRGTWKKGYIFKLLKRNRWLRQRSIWLWAKAKVYMDTVLSSSSVQEVKDEEDEDDEEDVEESLDKEGEAAVRCPTEAQTESAMEEEEEEDSTVDTYQKGEETKRVRRRSRKTLLAGPSSRSVEMKELSSTRRSTLASPFAPPLHHPGQTETKETEIEEAEDEDEETGGASNKQKEDEQRKGE